MIAAGVFVCSEHERERDVTLRYTTGFFCHCARMRGGGLLNSVLLGENM